MMRAGIYERVAGLRRQARRGTYVSAAIVALLMLAFAKLGSEVTEGKTLAMDKAVLLWFRRNGDPLAPIGPPWMPEAVRDLTSLGSFSVLFLIVTGVVATMLMLRRWRTAAFVLVAILGGVAISSMFKNFFDRPRPDLTAVVQVFTASFPSGHAAIAAVAYLTLGACLAGVTSHRRLKVFFLAYAAFLAFTIGMTRLYLGVHYPTDVVAGWIVGGAWSLLCWSVGSLLGVFDHPVTPADTEPRDLAIPDGVAASRSIAADARP